MPREQLYWVRIPGPGHPIPEGPGGEVAHLCTEALKTRHPGPAFCGREEEPRSWGYTWWQLRPGRISDILKRAAREKVFLCPDCVRLAMEALPEHALEEYRQAAAFYAKLMEQEPTVVAEAQEAPATVEDTDPEEETQEAEEMEEVGEGGEEGEEDTGEGDWEQFDEEAEEPEEEEVEDGADQGA